MRPRVGVSRHLLDQAIRAGSEPDPSCLPAAALDPHVQWVPHSLEVETGLGALLEVSRLTGQPGPGRAGDRTPLPMARDLDGYLWKATAPGGLRGGSLLRGDGAVFAERLTETLPLLTVAADGRPDDAASCEVFVERVFARARLRELFTGAWRPRDLVAFHSRHKLQLLAHDPVRYRLAGRMVARAGTLPPADVERDYRRLFNAAMADPATRGRHFHVLQRLFGHADALPDGAWRHDVLDTIEAYRRGELPLSIPLGLLAEGHADRDPRTWAAEQTYLAPFPAGLLPSQRVRVA